LALHLARLFAIAPALAYILPHLNPPFFMLCFRLLPLALALLAPLALHAQRTVLFQVNQLPPGTTQVGIRGSVGPLSWFQTTPMEAVGQGFEVRLTFADSVPSAQFKFVLPGSGQEPTWEGTGNRLVLLNQPEQTIALAWNQPQRIDPTTLPLLTPAQLQQDFKVLQQMVLKVHPGTYRYNSSGNINQALYALQQTFTQPQTYTAAYLAISKMLATIQCQHTWASFYNQNSLMEALLLGQRNMLPFTIQWFGPQMLVRQSALAGGKLPRGTQVISLNGVGVAQIKQALLPYVPADGGSNNSRLAFLDTYGFDFQPDLFDVLYPMVFAVQDSTVTAVVQLPGATQQRQTLQLPLMRIEQRAKLLGANSGGGFFKGGTKVINGFPTHPNNLWQYSTTAFNTMTQQNGQTLSANGKVGIITLNTYVTYGKGKVEYDYKKWLANTFKQIKQDNIEYLVIDQRLNSGGADEVLDELLTYFDIDRIVINNRVAKTRYLTFPESLKPYCRTWGQGEPWFYNLTNEQGPDAYGYYTFPEEMQVNRKNRKKKNMFTGPVYMLTSGRNVSLAYYAALAAQKYGFATTVGQETGGNLQGINGGNLMFMQLPNSGIEVDFPVMGDFNTQDVGNMGVAPYHTVTPTIRQFKAGVDAEMAFVIDLIAKSQY